MEQLKYTEILQQNKALAGSIHTTPYKISILSNVTINSLQEILEYNCRIHGIAPEVSVGNFDNIVQDSGQSAGSDMVIIMYDFYSIIDHMNLHFEAASDTIFDSLRSKLKAEIDLIANNLKHTPAVVFNTFSAALLASSSMHPARAEMLARDLNQYLSGKRTENIHLLDVDKLFLSVGLKQSIDFRFYHSSKAPYTVAFLKAYTLALQNLVLRNNGKLKKALIFDCDNTLWKGILGEDGIDGINMAPDSAEGQPYYRVQQLAAFLSSKGVIIGLCSKNNAQDVDEVLALDTCVLKNEHIVIKKVNWTDKASNLKAMALDLNIGLDSMVFVDDSPFEINLIREQVPEILTVEVPQHIADYPLLLQKLVDRYFNLEVTTDDASKTQMYKQQFEREESKSTFGSIEDYLASLQIVVTISKNDPQYIARIAQLTQKTNQFNLTTVRYTESQIEQFMNSSQVHIFAIFVKDKYGDSGLTGICITRQDEEDESVAVIDTLLMSCRIIGRNIEHVFLNNVITSLADMGYKTVQASYSPTKKNVQVATFFDEKGFVTTGVDEHGKKSYRLEMGDYLAPAFEYIKTEFI